MHSVTCPGMVSSARGPQWESPVQLRGVDYTHELHNLGALERPRRPWGP